METEVNFGVQPKKPYAIVRTGGKQYCLSEGEEVLVELLSTKNEGDVVFLQDVLCFFDGETLQLGQPTVPIHVECIFLGNERGKKLRTIKYKRRKNYKRTLGHRQEYTRLRIQGFKQAH